MWFEFSRQPHLGSEQDVINIPEHMDDDQVEVEEENKENIPVAVEALLPSIKLEPCNYDEIDDCHQKTEPQSDNRRPFSSSKQPKKTQFPSWSKNESFKNKNNRTMGEEAMTK